MQNAEAKLALSDPHLNFVTADADWLCSFAAERGIDPAEVGRQYAAGELAHEPIGYHIERGVGVIEITDFCVKRPSAFSVAAGFPAMTDIAAAIDELAAETDIRGVVLAFSDCPGSTTGFDVITQSIIRAQRAGIPVIAHVNKRLIGSVLVGVSKCARVFAGGRAAVGGARSHMLAWDWLSSEAPAGDIGEVSEQTERLLMQADDALVSAFLENRPHAARTALEQYRALNAEQAERAAIIDAILPRDAAIDRVARGDLENRA